MSNTNRKPAFFDEDANQIDVKEIGPIDFQIADSCRVSPQSIENLIEEEVKRQLQETKDLRNYGPPPAPVQHYVYRSGSPGQNPILLGQAAAVDLTIEQQVEYEMSGTIAHQELQEVHDNLQLSLGISRQLITMIERELEFEMQRRPSLRRFFESRKQALDILDDVVNPPENENPQADDDSGDQFPPDDEIPF